MITVHILTILICMGLSAFFSGIETGIISIHRFRLRHFVRQGEHTARILEYFVENFDRMLGTTLVGNNICLVMMSVIATSLAMQLGLPAAATMSSAVISVLVIIFGEYIPKAWFQARPIERCQRFALPLRTAEWVLRPFAVAIIAIARIFSPGERNKTFNRATPFMTRDDLKVLAREGEKGGALSSRERYMIHRVMELSNITAADIMIPKDEVVSVFDDCSLADFFSLARATNLIRFPVVNRETGRYTGIINVFYVLSSSQHADDETVAAFSRPPHRIPSKMPADRILPQMRRAGQPMSLVTEDDNVIGLVTNEDILRLIVGKL